MSTVFADSASTVSVPPASGVTIAGASTIQDAALVGCVAGRPVSVGDARLLAGDTCPPVNELCDLASEIRDRDKGKVVTFSPKVFIPLTHLCRDFCGYCTFRQSPETASRLYMSPEEVLAVARAGERLGCTEALFTLGERPELRYSEAKRMACRQRVCHHLGVFGRRMPAGLGRNVAHAPRQPRHHEPPGNGNP